MCENGFCSNIPGSYRCICPAGYRFSEKRLVCEGLDFLYLLFRIDCHKFCLTPNLPPSILCMGRVSTSCKTGFVRKLECCMLTIRDFICDLSHQCIIPCFTAVTDGKCYTKFNGIQCADPLKSELSHMQCCCGMEEMGLRAWGDSCAACPEKGKVLFDNAVTSGTSWNKSVGFLKIQLLTWKRHTTFRNLVTARN